MHAHLNVSHVFAQKPENRKFILAINLLQMDQ